jgi:enamine deaminase RidA (YjgF/YER057c/UK114 family)
MNVHLIRSSRLFPAAPYAYAAVAGPAGLVFTAGACPLDAHGTVIAPGDVAAQARQALANLRIALEDSGVRIEDVVKTTVYVASSDRADLVAAWNEVAAVFAGHDVPSTLLGVTVLGYSGQLVEIEAIAVAHPPAPASQPGSPPG